MGTVRGVADSSLKVNGAEVYAVRLQKDIRFSTNCIKQPSRNSLQRDQHHFFFLEISICILGHNGSPVAIDIQSGCESTHNVLLHLEEEK